MTTITGLTAERMAEIEAASVVDGDVVGDNLILKKHDGTTIDAGNVRGPVGVQGPVGWNWRGTYNIAVAYVAANHDAVLGSDGINYISVQNSTGIDPVTDTDHSHWVPDLPESVSNAAKHANLVTSYGAKADHKTVTDGAISSGLFALSSASAAFTAADVGKIVLVQGADKIAPPTGLTATPVASGGKFAAATYYYKVTAVNILETHPTSSSGETLPSAEASCAVVLNGKATIKWNAVPGAIAYKIYRATSAGGETGASTQVATVWRALPDNTNEGTGTWNSSVMSYSDLGYATVTGSAPSTNTAVCPLLATINSVAGGIATLDTAASQTVSGKRVDYATDNTTAFKAAATALPDSTTYGGGNGGVIGVPNGTYAFKGSTTPLDLHETYGICYSGLGFQGNHSDRPAASMLFFGLGAGVHYCHIDARSSYRFQLRNIGVRYLNMSYTGCMIDFSHSSGTDAYGFLIDGCGLSGDYSAHAYGATALLSVDLAIIGTVQNSYLGWAQRAVRGSQSGYANAIFFDKCTFDNCTISALTDAQETWVVRDCTFEGTNGLGRGPFAQATTGSTLGTTDPIWSLGVTALAYEAAAGARISLSTDTATGIVQHQVFTVAAYAAAGATTLQLCPQIPNYAYPTGTKVVVSGGSGLYRGYFAECRGGNVLWSGNWCGDAVHLCKWVDNGPSANGGGSHKIIGNFMSGGYRVVDLTSGGQHVVIGNQLGGDCGVDLGTDSSTHAHDGTVLIGNDLPSSPGKIGINGLKTHYRIAAFANGPTYGTNIEGGVGYTRFDLSRPLNFRPVDQLTQPAAVVKAAAGSGATSSLVAKGDATGIITLVTGTGTTSGRQTEVTMTLPLPPGADTEVFLTPANAAAASAQVWGNGYPESEWSTPQHWSIEAPNALTASTTYKWHYLIIQ